MTFVEFTKRENGKRISIDVTLIGSIHELSDKTASIAAMRTSGEIDYLYTEEDYDTIMKRIAEACRYA